MSKSKMNSKLQILLVDDDDVDAELIHRAFRKTGIDIPLHRSVNGQEGLEFLREQMENSHGAAFIVLLDLNMPLMGGIEFLDELRSDDLLGDTIVFALTTSDNDRDIVAAYDRNVAGYLVKSKVGDDFSGVMEMIEVYGKFVRFRTERQDALEAI